MRSQEHSTAGRAPGGGTDDSGQGPSLPPPADSAMTAERGAGGVVFDRSGNVLVLRHASGHWVFPKGHVEAGETELDTALREVREESGVLAECLSEMRWHTTYVNPRGRRRLITWYACEAVDTSLRLEDALFVEGGFFPAERALELLSHGADRKLLTGVLAWRRSQPVGGVGADRGAGQGDDAERRGAGGGR